jgi:spore germination cell wall hydrolase CwlJ-like protein
MNDEDILARTLYGEARGEGIDGIEAVACVIMNRFKARKWFTGYVIENGQKVPSVAQTCLKKWQFSCWNKNDPNAEKIKKVTEQDAVFAQCLAVARRAIKGELKDWTGGAVYYHTKQIKPVWAQGKYPCYALKNHLFYKDI